MHFMRLYSEMDWWQDRIKRDLLKRTTQPIEKLINTLKSFNFFSYLNALFLLLKFLGIKIEDPLKERSHLESEWETYAHVGINSVEKNNKSALQLLTVGKTVTKRMQRPLDTQFSTFCWLHIFFLRIHEWQKRTCCLTNKNAFMEIFPKLQFRDSS